MTFGAGDGGDEDEHVAALLDGHLVFFGLLAAAVDLAVGERVLAEIVRGEGELPAGERGVFEDREELGFQQLGVEEEEERGGGVDDVDGGDAAVGEVLFGEEHGVAVGVGDELVRGDGLAVGEDGDVGVVFAADFDEVGGELFVECVAACFEGRSIAVRLDRASGLRVGCCAASRSGGFAGGTGWRSYRCRRGGRGE